MSYHKGSWLQRSGALGDQAEEVFQEMLGPSAVPFGLRRPTLHVPSLPAFVRHMPDFITSKELLEVMGLGGDQILKLKHEKYNMLCMWNYYFPVRLGVHDSKNDRQVIAPLADVARWIKHDSTTTERFPEGHHYYAIRAAVIFDED